MSHSHHDKLNEIKLEFEEVVRVLKSAADTGKSINARRSSRALRFPQVNASRLESAVANANDAYALLLIATSESFLRAYLASVGVQVGIDPKLSTLIDKCRREFNRSNPKYPIRATDAVGLHNLRQQRNAYAHGHDSSVFPPVRLVVTILGRFFAHFP